MTPLATAVKSRRARHRSFGAVCSALLAPIAIAACGGASRVQPLTAATTTRPTTTPSSTVAPPPPIPIAAPQVGPVPASCSAYLAAAPGADDADKKKKACADNKSAIAALAAGATAESAGDHVARDAALSSLVDCERVPLLVTDVVRAELSPMECAESILAPALAAHEKEAMPSHQAAAHALVAASRLARLRPDKGAFDLLARAEVDAAAAEAGTRLVQAWNEAMLKEEHDAIEQSKGAPAELAVVVRFEIADAWLALATELRATPLPDEVKAAKAKDPDLETTYKAKLDEVTMPLVDRAAQIALAGLGMAIRDGILVKELPSFAPIQAAFRSRPGFETRPTRELELLLPAQAKGDAVAIARGLPPWAAYDALERSDPASLLGAPVLDALASHRGIPSTLRLEVEKDKKIDDAHKSAVALSRTRLVLSYGSRPDAEAVVAAWPSPKTPLDQLRVDVDRAVLGPSAKSASAGAPSSLAGQTSYELGSLDALAKTAGVVGVAAAYDAALLSLDAAQLFAPDPSDPSFTAADQRKAYEAAIARLDKLASLKGLSVEHAAVAKKLADGARETLTLLAKP